MTEYAYARVSTLDQDPRLQLDALLAAGVPEENIYVDHASGTRQDRPALAVALSSATAGDRLTVWRLDRLGRSLPHLVTTVEDLGRRGVLFRSLSDPIDTSTASGRLMSVCSLRLRSSRAGSHRGADVGRARCATRCWHCVRSTEHGAPGPG